MNFNKRAILIGLVFGDGSLRGKEHVELKIGHSVKQRPYLEHKRDLLLSVLGGKPAKIRNTKTTLDNGKTYHGYEFSKMHKYLRLLKKRMYPEGKKKLTTKYIHHMNAHTLALIYMDDGGLSVNLNKENKVSSFEVRIATHCTLEEANILKEFMLTKYDILIKPYKTKGSKGYTIRMNTTNGRKFLELTKEHAHESMLYKWDIQSRTRARNISSQR